MLVVMSVHATEDEVHIAYRHLARKYHPDLNRDDPNAQKKFIEIQEAYERILNFVNPRYTRVRPQAKLARALTALLPSELHTCYTWASAVHVRDLLLGRKDLRQYESAVLVRGRLREILTPPKRPESAWEWAIQSGLSGSSMAWA